MGKNIAAALDEKIKSLVCSMGYEFVGSEWRTQGGGGLLRVYIDNSSGITLNDCSFVSRQLSAMLDVEESILGQYVLEVSSPGIDRPLFEIEQYQKQIGQRVKLSLRTPIQNRRRWVGTLLCVKNEEIHVLVDAVEIVVPFSNIEKANVIANIHL